MYDLTQVNITTTKKRRKNGFGDKPLNTSKKLLPQLEKKKKKKKWFWGQTTQKFKEISPPTTWECSPNSVKESGRLCLLYFLGY